VQAFFTELLERDRLKRADQQRGRFRSFLLASLNHFLANHWRALRAEKRGGGTTRCSINFAQGEERYSLEPYHEWTAERVYERRWAITLLDNALSRLRAEYVAAGKEESFELLKLHLGGSDDRTPYEELARGSGMTAGALKVAAHRLRRRCREILREEIAETVASVDEVEGELQALFRAVSSE
jgi:RNA polymerase sigma-70 factor (ECF subfamily)